MRRPAPPRPTRTRGGGTRLGAPPGPPPSEEKKRGKKAPLVLKGPFTSEAVATFIVSNALPDVTPLPELSRAGVDANARVGLALQGTMDKLFVFHTDG